MAASIGTALGKFVDDITGVSKQNKAEGDRANQLAAQRAAEAELAATKKENEIQAKAKKERNQALYDQKAAGGLGRESTLLGSTSMNTNYQTKTLLGE